MCGHDGITYASECALNAASCIKQEAIIKIYDGECKIGGNLFFMSLKKKFFFQVLWNESKNLGFVNKKKKFSLKANVSFLATEFIYQSAVVMAIATQTSVS